MAFEALIFDVGGVIVPHDNEAMFRRLASRCDHSDALERIRQEAHDPRYMTGELPVGSLHTLLVDELRYGADLAQFEQDVCSHLSIDADMLTLVGLLARSNRVALFSNTNAIHWAHVERLSGGAIGAFEAYLSHEIGAVKPDLEAFALVARRAAVEPGRCLFIDDLMANVEAARQAGFQAEPFTSQTTLTALLERRGVAWSQMQAGDA
jgi:HAD superfamily hydrolase (TIGR01509 family)